MVALAVAVKKDSIEVDLGLDLNRTGIVMRRPHATAIFARDASGFGKAAGEKVQAQDRWHISFLLMLRGERLGKTASGRHADLDQVQQRFEAHATLEHADEILQAEADLLTRLNQPLYCGVDEFIGGLAQRGETVFERRLLTLIPRADHRYSSHVLIPHL
jgi:hypothetical protein